MGSIDVRGRPATHTLRHQDTLESDPCDVSALERSASAVRHAARLESLRERLIDGRFVIDARAIANRLVSD